MHGLGEGEGLASLHSNECSTGPSDATSKDDHAPPHASHVRSRGRSNTLDRLQTGLSHGLEAVSRHDAVVGQDGNARFLEHFRYILVASHLLDEHPDQGLLRAAVKQEVDVATRGADTWISPAQRLYTLAILAVVGAGSCKWLMSRHLTVGPFLGLVSLLVTALAIGLLSIRHLAIVRWRNEALQAGTILVQRLQAFEVSLASSFALLQEVEVVSKGFRLYVDVSVI